jgi:hypothetical protein
MKQITVELKSRDHGERSYTVMLPDTVAESVQSLGEEKTLAMIHRGIRVAAQGAEWGKLKERETIKVTVNGKQVSASKGVASEIEKLRAELAKLQAGGKK